jgi:hypothetical protein
MGSSRPTILSLKPNCVRWRRRSPITLKISDGRGRPFAAWQAVMKRPPTEAAYLTLLLSRFVRHHVMLMVESRQCVQPVTPSTHSTDRRHPLTGDFRCGSYNRRNCHHLSLSQNWCGRCDPFSTRLLIRLMPLTGHPRQKRRWRNEFCGPHQMGSLTR